MAKIKKIMPNVTKTIPTDAYCVYLGPSIRGVIQYGSIHSGTVSDVTERLADEIIRYPLISSLIISGAELPSARVLIKTQGNSLNVAYQRLCKLINNKGEI